MNINQRFAIFCAKQCLHLWQAPKEVLEWLHDPRKETALEAADVAYVEGEAVDTAADAGAWAAAYAAWAASYAAYTAAAEYAADPVALAAARAARAAKAADALNTTEQADALTEQDLRQQFVASLSDEELSTTDSDWIEYATAEIFERAT